MRLSDLSKVTLLLSSGAETSLYNPGLIMLNRIPGLLLGGSFHLKTNSLLKNVSLQVNLSNMLGSEEMVFTFNGLFIQPQKEAPYMFA